MPTRQQQRVGELQFLLYSRPLHPEFFDIYHDHRIVKGDWEAQIWITGLRHAIGFYRETAAVAEVISDATAPLPHRGKVLALPVRGEKQHQYEHDGGIRYMMNLQVETVSQRLYGRLHRDLADQAEKTGGLFVPFPQWAGNALAPFTYIDYESKVGQLHVFVYHAFPAERTLIKTQSIFEVV